MAGQVDTVVLIVCAISALLCLLKIASMFFLWRYRAAATLQFPHILLFPMMLTGSMLADAFVLIRSPELGIEPCRSKALVCDSRSASPWQAGSARRRYV